VKTTNYGTVVLKRVIISRCEETSSSFVDLNGKGQTTAIMSDDVEMQDGAANDQETLAPEHLDGVNEQELDEK